MSNRVTPNSLQLSRSVSICFRLIGSAIGRLRSDVGTLWSGVAIVRSARRIGRPFKRSPSNALGARHFMNQVQIDVKNRRALLGSMYNVLVPDFFKHGPRGGRIGIRHLVQNTEEGNQVTRFTVNSRRRNVNG